MAALGRMEESSSLPLQAIFKGFPPRSGTSFPSVGEEEAKATEKQSRKGKDMKRLSIGVFLAASLLIMLAPPGAADPPSELTIQESFDDTNVCTGEPQTVTGEVTFFFHEHDGRVIARGERTITTTTGFSGRGTSSFVMNGQVEMFRFTDIVTNDAGDRIRARGVFLLDLSSETVRVDTFELTCLGG